MTTNDIYAGIDIGSNTIRLILGSFDDNKLHIITKFQSITRLGKDFYKTGSTSDESRKKSLDTLKEYSRIIKEHDVQSVTVCATGVLRSADNSKDFVDDVLNKTELVVKIISGEEEARLTALGVNSVVGTKDSVIFDVGGGSTEFMLSKEGLASEVFSVNLGAVTLYESYIKNDPPEKSGLESMNAHIKNSLTRLIGVDSDRDLIFTAGTATTLAAIKLKMADYDPELINGTKMTYDETRALYDDLINKRKEERESIIGLEKEREDIIISGTAIALNSMEILKKDVMTISDSGLLEGMIIHRYLTRHQ